jgi:hypothetical protein
LNAVLHVLSKPGSQSAETPSLLQMHIFNLSIISIALLDKRVPDAGLQKRATFSALNVGPVGTWDRARATCVAGSGSNHSAIYRVLASQATSRLGINLSEAIG